MKKLFVISLLLFHWSCSDEDFNPERRYIEKIVIHEGHVTGFDVSSGPDLKLKFYSRGDTIESEMHQDVIILPVTFNDVSYELTDSTFRLQVLDEDVWDPDDVLFDRTFRPYRKTEDGNPFQLIYPEWVIDVHWRTQ